MFVRAAFYIDLLGEQGPLLGEPYPKQLDGKLRELRFYLDGDAVRVTYRIAPDRRIMMKERSDWQSLRERRMSEPGAKEEYQATRLAFELGKAVRERREQQGWSQTDLAKAADMTQSAVARFEAGGTVPTLKVLERIARALDAELTVRFTPKPSKPMRPARA